MCESESNVLGHHEGVAMWDFSLTLATTISPSSVSSSTLGYAPPQAEALFIHTLAPSLAILNETCRHTTFIRNIFYSRIWTNLVEPPTLILLLDHERLTRGSSKLDSDISGLNTTLLPKTLKYNFKVF
jgi:hypothetical protein